ncbi:MAG: hypothetical protein ATN34_02070 [Epulopiscium sp. Nele67-Bin002]|nr:MAG: nitrogen fixation protein NifD [Epulopiscium sp. Nuni2H_MBin001]OON91009.1 MAG: nitrogen fixation protein NifD [Epulopiscium sp. Nele67-Bin001]OON91767.1 MAG: hypothetical protein ATN34_02070 [Epulopiscium sp. Nele67-Bin002]
MKMVMAIIRPDKFFIVKESLAQQGFYASTKWDVAGRGKQKGIQVGNVVYEEMSKTTLFIVCQDDDKNKVIDIIMDAAISGDGNPGDGKIFVLPVEESYTISDRSKDEIE